MSTRTAPETEDRIVQLVGQRPGLTAYEYAMRLRLIPRTISVVLARLEEAGRVAHADVQYAARSRRLWYPTLEKP